MLSTCISRNLTLSERCRRTSGKSPAEFPGNIHGRASGRDSRTPGHETGFTLIELLVGLALALCIAAAAAPLWLSLERTGSRETDKTVQSLQGRVAVARLERDLRLASAAGCPFSVTVPVLEASPSQVVFLERTGEDDAPILVEWEITNRALMRRWGFCPEVRPTDFRHSLFRDHKTMLEDIDPESSFAYVLGDAVLPGPIPAEDLDAIEAVILDGDIVSDDGRGSVEVLTTARVAR